MTAEKKNEIIDLCEQLDSLAIANIISNYNLQNVGTYSAESFVASTNRMTRQLREELENGIGLFLPVDYNFNNEFNSGSLDADVRILIDYIRASQSINQAAYILNRLIYYQIANGFWDRGQRSLYSTNMIKAKELKDKAEALEANINNKINLLNQEKDKLTRFIEEKEEELNNIEKKFTAITKNTAETNSLLNESTSNNEKINSILTQQKEKLDEIKNLLEEQKKEGLNYKTQLEEINTSGVTQLNLFISNNEQVKAFVSEMENKKAFFDEQNAELDTLIGKKVGASLFETFKQRKDELEGSVTFWKWSVPFMAIITVAWVFFLFWGFVGITDTTQKWEFIALNALKTLPVIFILFFTIDQYKKERNIQEEYAFKSAVALTVNAYANQIKLEENKDRLILDAIGKIYTTPMDKRVSKSDDGKNLIEGLKALKDTVNDIIKTTKG